MSTIMDERKAEARAIVEDHLIGDVGGVFESAQPLSDERFLLAEAISRLVSIDLEAHIRAVTSPGAPKAEKSKSGTKRKAAAEPPTAQGTEGARNPSMSRTQQPPTETADPAESSALPPAKKARVFPPPLKWLARLAEKASQLGISAIGASSSAAPQPTDPTNTYNDLVGWVTMKMPESVIKKEAHMYPGINAFVEFVADSVSRHMQKHGNNGKARRIVPFGKTDVKPDGADDRTRIDHMLTCCAKDGPVDQPHYAKALCLVEAKYSQKDQTDAYEQLVRYSRNIYANQPHRRFLWGLTVCGTLVRACLLSNDKIYASETVDVASPEGRGRFVGLLVNWSLCEIPRLGYDSTMGCNDAGDKWSIEVFDGDARNTYSNLAQVFPAYSLRGRHTRCFVGTIEADGDEKQVLIKDCWSHFVNEDADSPHADEEGTNSLRDEVTFLREILTKLSAERSLDGKYPRLEMGGVVRVAGRGAAVAAGRNAAVVEDTTTAAMSDLALAKPVPLRKHMRIVMSPVGEPLQTVNSPDELIVAMFDAMEAHTEIVRRCRILHRDISINNILVRRTDGVVGGMLIDFDNAIRVDSNHTAARPDMTGTLPYMSISNLMANDVKRTALDDWESCIYILCWLATMGVNEGDEKLHKKSKRLSVDEWRDGDTETIAGWKRGHMETTGAFKSNILDQFIGNPRYRPLKDLAESLHEGLFFNDKASPLCEGCYVNERGLKKLHKGMWSFGNLYDAEVSIDVSADPKAIDPFERRAKIADMIVADLLETFRVARNKAKERLRVAQMETISK